MKSICNRTRACWGEKFINASRFWPEDDLRLVVSYSDTISDAIERAFRNSGVRDLENAQPKLECLKCEEQYYYADKIRKNPPAKETLFQKVYGFASFRIWGSFPSLIRQEEAAYVQPEHSVRVYDEKLERDEVGFKDSEQNLLITPKGSHQAAPDKIFFAKEDLKLLQKAISEIEISKRLYAPVYAKILRMHLRGIDVGRKHATILGIPEEEVIPVKFQAFRLVCEVMAKYDPDLIEKQKRYREEKTRKWKIERTNFMDRLAQYYPTEEELREREPRTIRDWRVASGNCQSKGEQDAKDTGPTIPVLSEAV